VSDRANSGEYKDLSGPAMRECLDSYGSKFLIKNSTIVPDEIKDIQQAIMAAHIDSKANLILTSGGTGFTPRDVTPEATMPLLTKQADSLVQHVMAESSKITPLAYLSRCKIGVIITKNE
jgi:molybdenum cofactor synthesis domain-containing protein